VAAQRNVRLKNEDLENRQKLWRWLVVGALMILLVETWLAGRLHRRATGGLLAQSALEKDPSNFKEAPVSAIS
jgi:hypothetical protein